MLPADKQPEIIEFAAVKLDPHTLEEQGHIHFLCKPRVLPLPPVITKITGITTERLQGQPPFTHYFPQVQDFFLGERMLVAHNLPFDRAILSYELRRLDREYNFPWPIEHLCTVELTTDIQGKSSKQEWLYEHYTGKPANQTHRALDDVRQLATIVRHLRREGRI